MADIYRVDPELVKQIKWQGDPIAYDLELQQLCDENRFLVINPWLEDPDLHHYIHNVPASDKCIVWGMDGEWIAKCFNSYWEPSDGYEEIILEKPKLIWRKNPDLDRMMAFVDDPINTYDPGTWERQHELVWYLDNRVNPLEDRVWAVKCIPSGIAVRGIHEMPSLMPKVKVEVNNELPDFNLNVDELYPPYWDLAYECVYNLDSEYNTDGDVWAVKFTPEYRKPMPAKVVGTVSPELIIEYNPKLPKLDYDVSYSVSWDNLNYEHVWMLDNKHKKTEEKEIWAFKIKASAKTKQKIIVDYVSPIMTYELHPDLEGMQFEGIEEHVAHHKEFEYRHCWKLDTVTSTGYDMVAVTGSYVDKPKGDKYVGTVFPAVNIQKNPKLPRLEMEVDYNIPYHDKDFKHVWYLDTDWNQDNVWALTMSLVDNPTSTKEMGIVTPLFEPLDVVFISYNEDNAEENWQRVLEFAPYAQRVDGVKGIMAAHKAAAELCETDMFFVVDGDAYLEDDWSFNFQPGIFDRDCAYIWHSRNPINGLTYGNGGVKLLPRAYVLHRKTWTTLDFSTTVTKKLKVIEEVSNTNRFNTSEYATWRSAFRECVKLCYNMIYDSDNSEHEERYNDWLTKGSNKPFGEYAQLGAQHAREFIDNARPDQLKNINDEEWLLKEYNVRFGREES